MGQLLYLQQEAFALKKYNNKTIKMKFFKYTLFVLGGIMALNVIGGLFMGRAIPILWVIMIAFFIGGALIKIKK
jgi:hypothetical protein